LQVGLLTAVPKSSGGRQGCAVQPAAGCWSRRIARTMHAGSFSSYAAMCAPTAATSYCFPVEHGAHASSPVPPAGPRF